MVVLRTGLELSSSTTKSKAGTAAVMPSPGGFGRSCVLYRSNDGPRGRSIGIWTAYRAFIFQGTLLLTLLRNYATQKRNKNSITPTRDPGPEIDKYIVASNMQSGTRTNGFGMCARSAITGSVQSGIKILNPKKRGGMREIKIFR